MHDAGTEAIKPALVIKAPTSLSTVYVARRLLDYYSNSIYVYASFYFLAI